MGNRSSPETLGYDFSDGPTKNKDGGFVNNKDQWTNTVMDDPKKIFSLTEKAIQFLETNAHNNTLFSSSFSLCSSCFFTNETRKFE